MILAKVIEPIVASIKYPLLEGERLLLVQSVSLKAKTTYGERYWVIDRLGARVGDYVLILNEGGSVRMALEEGNKKIKGRNYINAIVAGIVEAGYEGFLDTQA